MKKGDYHRLKHAQKRARERYGIELSFEDIERLEAEIRAGRAIRSMTMEDRKSVIWIVRLASGRAAHVAALPDAKIVTFLEHRTISQVSFGKHLGCKGARPGVGRGCGSLNKYTKRDRRSWRNEQW